MLSIDNKEFKVPQEFKEMIKTDKRKVFIFKVSKNRVSWNKENNRQNVPASENFDPFYNVVREDGEGMLRYYTSGIRSERADTKYLPVHFTFLNGNDIVILKKEYEKLYFFWNHPNNESNPLFNGSRKIGMFYLEDKVTEARVKVKKSKALREALDYIYKDMPKEDLVEIAAANNIPNAASLEEEEILVMLETMVKRVDKLNPGVDPAQEFLDKIKTTNTKLQAEIQTAVDKKVIRVMADRWHWINDSKLGKQICKIRGNEDPKERLEKYFSSEDGKEDLAYMKEKMEETELAGV